jgi:tripartite-type tricarboxylate transporter receptor subunit TctC
MPAPRRVFSAQGCAGSERENSHGTIRKTLQEPKLQENLKSRGYNIDLRTTTADLNKLVKEEIDSMRGSRRKTSVGRRSS